MSVDPRLLSARETQLAQRPHRSTRVARRDEVIADLGALCIVRLSVA